MALCKLLGKCLLIAIHAMIKLLLGNIYIVDLDVEILTSGKRVSLLLKLFIGYCDREIINTLFVLEGIDNLVHLKWAKATLLINTLLILLAQLARINQDNFIIIS